MPAEQHSDETIDCVTCAIVTVSDTRTPASDHSGPLVRERLESAGHRIESYEIISDVPELVRARLITLCDDEACQAVMLTGGTGLTTRDTTFEAVNAILEKHLSGFGELFRMLSYNEVGSAAMLSRATAGVRNATAVFSMPGSIGAVRLAMDKLILPELGHIASLIRK